MKSIGWGLVIITLITGIFFSETLIDKKVLVPGDIIVGMYYPWLSEKWGYSVGVPVKNPIISDVVSQVFIWKKLVADAYRKGSLPLWNPYSYSGYPLLANFQSGALYPFNLLMVWWGDIWGWNWLLIFGVWGGAVAMYLFLKNKGMENQGAVCGSISYALSLYAITWMEYVTTAQMMVWFPLMLLSADRAIKGKQEWKLMLPAAIFMAITAGRFEVLVYMLVTLAAYVFFLGFTEKKWKWIWGFGLLSGVGMGLGAVQILPTVEMGLRSIRFLESYIAGQNWGLIPPVQLITGIAPDFFGNPATGNHWGWWQYHETVFYTGIVAVMAVLTAFFRFKKLGSYRFFLGLAVIALILGVDNPVSVAVMQAKIPVLSTVSAGRIFVLFTTGAAVLTGWWADSIKTFSKGVLIRSVVYPVLALTVMVITVAGMYVYLHGGYSPVPETKLRLMVALKNSVLPFGLLVVMGIILIFRQKKYFGLILILVISADLTRAGWKFLPTVDESLVFPTEKVINFLVDKSKTDIFRVDRESGEVLPPNTWAAYNLMSPSGYDSLAQTDYVSAYSQELNFSKPILSRYSELGSYNAEAMGKFNVKYLLAIKRDEKGRIPGNILSYKINEQDWKRVLETENIVVLENNKYQPRAQVIGPGSVKITQYDPGRAVLNYEASQTGTVIRITDTFYPGWVECEQNKCKDVEKDGAFMKIKTLGSKGDITLVYRPGSFKQGLMISALAFIMWGVVIVFWRGGRGKGEIRSGRGFPYGLPGRHFVYPISIPRGL